jgi:hypothetical protein
MKDRTEGFDGYYPCTKKAFDCNLNDVTEPKIFDELLVLWR